MIRLFTYLILVGAVQWVHAQKTSYNLQLVADNLSEDKNILASKDDEIIIQLYEVIEEDVLNRPLLYKTLRFHEGNRTQIVEVNVDPLKEYYLFLTEYEYEQSFQRRTPIYRIYHKEIFKCHKAGGCDLSARYLDSDDLLGAEIINRTHLEEGLKIVCSGVQHLERFMYSISFTPAQ